MKTAALRDAMVVRVKAALVKWPTFDDMPDDPDHDIRVEFKADLSDHGAYVSALHSICAVATPSGRSGNDMVGWTDPDAAAAKQRSGGAGFELASVTPEDVGKVK